MGTTAPDATTVRLHRLTMIAEQEGVTVGRPDTASYAVFPEEGAQAIRMLDAGTPVGEMAEWYEETCGEPLDVQDFLEVLDDLGFLLAEGEEREEARPVRWQRLGRWTFSVPAWILYAALLAGATVATVDRPWLRPSYHDVFFTGYLSLIPVVMTVVQIPCILFHEAYHALAGRRLGLPSSFGISRRLYYVVAETRLDSLLSVPRRKRYLPFFAGILADAVLAAGFTLLALALHGGGVPHWVPALSLSIAFSIVLRLIWQLMFYLQTDLYYVFANLLRCADLQNATRFQVRARIRRLLRRPPGEPDADWSDRDRQMARWYAPVLVAGYCFSLGSLAWAGIPTIVHFMSLIVDRLSGSGTSLSAVLDATSFLTLTSLQFGTVAYVALRDRRRRRTSTQGALA